MGRIWFPTARWWGLMIFVVPAVALLGVAATIIISTRVKTFMEAYQASGILVILIIFLMVAQVTGQPPVKQTREDPRAGRKRNRHSFRN